MEWLITEDAYRDLAQAQNAFIASPTISAEFKAFMDDDESRGSSRILSVADKSAEIRIEGPLTAEGGFRSWLFGGTQYIEIRDALAAADADPAVKNAVLAINSPGGTVDGLFETLDAIRAFSKPLSVRASCACSAAYAIAAVAGGKIEATSDAAQFGSIGVAAKFRFGADEVLIDITSTEAPDKVPDVTTDEGKAVVRKRLDDIHGLFVDSIAAGRGISVKQVNADFGRGAVFLAREAKSAGLIDTAPKKARRPRMTADDDTTIVADTPDAPESTPAAEPQTEALLQSERGETTPSTEPRPAATPKDPPMNQDELKTQHPELFAAVSAAGAEKAASDAVASERDRVNAHLIMGEKSGDMKTAHEAIASGEGMTQTLQATYMAAGMNLASRETRETEGEEAEAATSDTTTVDDDKDLGDLVADAMAEKNKGAL